jgi:hypothetical protein
MSVSGVGAEVSCGGRNDACDPFQTCVPIGELMSRRAAPDVTQGPRAGSWVAHGYPFEDTANAKFVVHLAGWKTSGPAKKIAHRSKGAGALER